MRACRLPATRGHADVPARGDEGRQQALARRGASLSAQQPALAACCTRLISLCCRCASTQAMQVLGRCCCCGCWRTEQGLRERGLCRGPSSACGSGVGLRQAGAGGGAAGGSHRHRERLGQDRLGQELHAMAAQVCCAAALKGCQGCRCAELCVPVCRLYVAMENMLSFAPGSAS